MNLIEALLQVPNENDITLLDKEGYEDIKVTKRGSFANVVRMLTEITSEENMLSDRWRWRLS